MRKIGQSAHPPPPPQPAHPVFHPHSYAPQHHYEEPYKSDYYNEHKPEYYEPKQEYYEPKPIAYSHNPPFPQYNSFYDEAFKNYPSVETIPSIPLYSSYEQSHPEDDYGSGYRDYNGYYEKRSTSETTNKKKIAKSPITARQHDAKPETNSQSDLLTKMLQHQRHLQLQHHEQNNVLLPASTQALWNISAMGI